MQYLPVKEEEEEELVEAEAQAIEMASAAD
jgi:hypothetical protein